MNCDNLNGCYSAKNNFKLMYATLNYFFCTTVKVTLWTHIYTKSRTVITCSSRTLQLLVRAYKHAIVTIGH